MTLPRQLNIATSSVPRPVSGFTIFIPYKKSNNDSYYDNMSVKIPKNIIYLHFWKKILLLKKIINVRFCCNKSKKKRDGVVITKKL